MTPNKGCSVADEQDPSFEEGSATGSPARNCRSNRSSSSAAAAPQSKAPSTSGSKHYVKMISREVTQMLDGFNGISEISPDMFYSILSDYGYASEEHLPLVFNLFHMITGVVKECHRGTH